MNDTDKIMKLVWAYGDDRAMHVYGQVYARDAQRSCNTLHDAIKQLVDENASLRKQNTMLDRNLDELESELESEQDARQDAGKLEREIERLQQQLAGARSECTALRVNERNLEARLAVGTPVGEVRWAANVEGSIKEVRWKDKAPAVGTSLYTAPLVAAEPAQREPLTATQLGGEWVPCAKLPITVHVRHQRPGEAHVSTREGITPVKHDDLIMRGVSGEEYPIGREIFEKTYTLNTTPPAAQREPLTDAQIDEIRLSVGPVPVSYIAIARAIEAAHGIGSKP